MHQTHIQLRKYLKHGDRNTLNTILLDIIRSDDRCNRTEIEDDRLTKKSINFT